MALLNVAEAASTSVAVRDNFFDPARTKVKVGDRIVWKTGSSNSDAHNVREDNKIFYSGSPDRLQFSFERVFSAGTFHYYCEIHGFRGGGMDGMVKVPVKLGAAPSGPAFTVVWASSGSNTGSRYTIQHKVGSGSWKTWKSRTSLRKATFRSAVVGKRYTFRAKSIQGDAESRWSPPSSLNA